MNCSRSLILFASYLIFAGCAGSQVKSISNQQNKDYSNSIVGTECESGATKTGFLQQTVAGENQCSTGLQTCLNGKWIGAPVYENCINSTKSCGQYPHGATLSGYLAPIAIHGAACVPVMTTCLDGEWTGPIVHASCAAK